MNGNHLYLGNDWNQHAPNSFFFNISCSGMRSERSNYFDLGYGPRARLFYEREEGRRGGEKRMKRGRCHFLFPSAIVCLGKFERKKRSLLPLPYLFLFGLHMEQEMKKGCVYHDKITHP